MKKNWLQSYKAEILANPRTRAIYEEMAPKYELAGEFIAARAHAKLTQEQLAERMGTSQSAVARIESGNRIPSVRTLQRFAAATGTRLVIRLVPLARAAAGRGSRRSSPAKRRSA